MNRAQRPPLLHTLTSVFAGLMLFGCLMDDGEPRARQGVIEKALFSDDRWLLEQTVVLSDPGSALEVGLSSGLVEISWQVTEGWLVACDAQYRMETLSVCVPVGWFPIEDHVMRDGSADPDGDWRDRDALILDWNLLVENAFFFPDARTPDSVVSGVQLQSERSVRLHHFEPESPPPGELEGTPFEAGELYQVEFEQLIHLRTGQDGSDAQVIGIETRLTRRSD